MQRPTINTLNIKKQRKYPLVVKKVKNVVCSAANESEGGACVSAKVERQKKKTTWFTLRYLEQMMSSLHKLTGLKSVCAVV